MDKKQNSIGGEKRMGKEKATFEDMVVKISADTESVKSALNELEKQADRLVRKFERLSELTGQLGNDLK